MSEFNDLPDYSVVVSEMAGLSSDVDPLQLWGHLQLHRTLQVYLDPRPHLIRQVKFLQPK